MIESPLSTESTGSLPAEADLPTLLALLDNPIGSVRRFAIHALRELGDPAAIPALLDTLADPRAASFAEEIAIALREFLSLEAIPLLAQGAGHPAPAARRAALRALRDFRSGWSTPALLRGATDSAEEVRREAIIALGQLRTPEVIPVLRHALDDPDIPVRLHAVAGLAHFANANALAPLLHAARNDHWQVRRDAAVAIARFPYGAAAPALLRLLGDADWRVVREALLSLAHLRAPFSAYYLPLVEHPIPDVRIAAAAALAETKDSLAIGALRTLAEDRDPTVAQSARISLHALIDPGEVWP